MLRLEENKLRKRIHALDLQDKKQVKKVLEKYHQCVYSLREDIKKDYVNSVVKTGIYKPNDFKNADKFYNYKVLRGITLVLQNKRILDNGFKLLQPFDEFEAAKKYTDHDHHHLFILH